VQYQVTHTTVYEYDHPVSVSHHLLWLTPRQGPRQRAIEQRLTVEPEPALVTQHTDYFGNTVTFMTLQGLHRKLTVTSVSQVDLTTTSFSEPASTLPWTTIRELCSGCSWTGSAEASDFAFPSSLVPRSDEFADYARPSFPANRPILDAGLDLMKRIHRDFTFDPQATTVATPLPQVLKNRRGVCQDFAHLQIACLRSLGLAARYVSGYLETIPPPNQPKLVGADASHAWLQIWCGEAGWVDLDPTNSMIPAQRHITVAWGRDYSDVTPLRGVIIGSGNHQLHVAVDVVPLEGWESPLFTQPSLFA
jgi:transglutaminase-like putative cysteine protease